MCAALQVVSPPGRIFQLTAPSRKDIAKLVAALDGATTHSLGLRKLKDEDGDSSDHALHEDAAQRRKHKLVVRRQADVTDPTLRKKKCRVSCDLPVCSVDSVSYCHNPFVTMSCRLLYVI